MKALSIQQPWAWLIVNGYKGVENRTWSTTHRGPLLIHAGTKLDQEGYRFVWDHFPQVLYTLPNERSIERGGIVGSARLIEVLRYNAVAAIAAQDVPWFFGPYGFVLREAKPLPFRALRGQLGLFEVPDA